MVTGGRSLGLLQGASLCSPSASAVEVTTALCSFLANASNGNAETEERRGDLVDECKAEVQVKESSEGQYC